MNILKLLQNPQFVQVHKSATDFILSHVKLPEGQLNEGVEQSSINGAYAVLSIVHEIERAQVFSDLADKADDHLIRSWFSYDAWYELNKVYQKVSKAPDDWADFLVELWGSIVPLEEKCVHIEPPALKTSLNPTTKAYHLVLVTDLYRDFDDWLTLLHVVLLGQYRALTIITSNEVNGQCAQITAQYAIHLKALAKALHDSDLDIEVFQGLSAYDFALLSKNSDYKEHVSKYQAVHYPDKMYSGAMRIPTLSLRSVYHQYVDLFDRFKRLNEHPIDMFSIAKTADLDVVLKIAKDSHMTVHDLVMLGCRQGSTSTNTNAPFHHLKSLPEEGIVMLDSQYGRDKTFGIHKKTFASLLDKIYPRGFYPLEEAVLSELEGEANPVEQYLHQLLNSLLRQSKHSGKAKRATKMIVRSTLAHLKLLHYDRGNTFDLFSLLARDYLVSGSQTPIYYQLNNNHQPQCYPGHPIGADAIQLRVFYPDIKGIHESFVQKLSQSTEQFIHRSHTMQTSTDIRFNLHQKYGSLLNHYGYYDDTSDERAERTLTGLDEYLLIIRSLLILDLLASDLSDEEVANKIASGFPEAKEIGFDLLKGTAPETIVPKIIPNVNYLRELLKGHDLEDIRVAYIMHDLGKCKSFVQENALESGEAKAAQHDEYLERYLQKNAMTSSKDTYIVKLLDVLGHSPEKMVAPGPFPSLRSLGKTGVFIKDFAEQYKNKPIGAIESRQMLLAMLLDRAHDLQLEKNIAVLNSVDVSIPFMNLSPEQKSTIAFVMWTGGLRLHRDTEEGRINLAAFQNAWDNRKHSRIVSAMTEMLMKNLDQSEDHLFLYNVTGLIHKNVRPVIGFLTPGRGASYDEVVEVAFPFILDEVNKVEDLSLRSVSHNEFQVQQMIEAVANLLPYVSGLVPINSNQYRYVDFGTPEMSHALGERLENHRKKQSDSSMRWFKCPRLDDDNKESPDRNPSPTLR